MRASIHVAAAATVITIIAADMTCSVAAAMSLGFSWAGVPRCTSNPPAFTLSDVPAGTSQLSLPSTWSILICRRSGTAAARYPTRVAIRSLPELSPTPGRARPPASGTITAGPCGRSMPAARRSQPRAPPRHFLRADRTRMIPKKLAPRRRGLQTFRTRSSAKSSARFQGKLPPLRTSFGGS